MRPLHTNKFSLGGGLFQQAPLGGLSLRVNAVLLVIPVSEPTKAGGFDGIHFRLGLFASSLGRLYSRVGWIGIEHNKNERRIF